MMSLGQSCRCVISLVEELRNLMFVHHRRCLLENHPQTPKNSCKTMVQKIWYRTITFLGFLHHEDWLQDRLRARLHRCPGNPPATGCAPTCQVQPYLSGEGVWGHR